MINVDPGILLFILFGVLLICNIPIAFCLIVASLVVMTIVDVPFAMISTIMFSSVSKFTLLAVPFFIMAGIVMEKGGVS